MDTFRTALLALLVALLVRFGRCAVSTDYACARNITKSAAAADQLVWQLAKAVEVQAHTRPQPRFSTRQLEDRQEKVDLSCIYRLAGTIWQHFQGLFCKTTSCGYNRSASIHATKAKNDVLDW